MKPVSNSLPDPATARSEMPSPLKSPTATPSGLVPTDRIESGKLMPAGVSVAVPSTALLLLVLRNETVPVGVTREFPVTVAVSL